jgi:hypothetical protein
MPERLNHKKWVVRGSSVRSFRRSNQPIAPAMMAEISANTPRPGQAPDQQLDFGVHQSFTRKISSISYSIYVFINRVSLLRLRLILC